MPDITVTLQDAVDEKAIVELQFGDYIRGNDGAQGEQGEQGPIGDVTPAAEAARDAALDAQAAAEAARDAAELAQTAAETAASGAASSATSASTSATNASNSANAASVSAGNAATSETNAGASATSASGSATAAAASATSAAGSATSASTSETNAAASAAAASTSEANAATSEANAAATLANALVKANNLSDLSNIATARRNLGAESYSRVVGQTGANNATTPDTQYDFSAEAVVLRDANGSTVVITNTGVVTNNISTAGPAANGRDQAGAFTASVFVHFYWIWNGTTLATLSSQTAPPTGPTLPTGYTHWAYIGAFRFDSLSQLSRMQIMGSDVYYNVAGGGFTRILIEGKATSFTTVSLASLIPTTSTVGFINTTLSANHSSAPAIFAATLRQTGMSYTVATSSTIAATTGFTYQSRNTLNFPMGASSSIDYTLNAAPSGATGLTIDVLGYKVNNGDS